MKLVTRNRSLAVTAALLVALPVGWQAASASMGTGTTAHLSPPTDARALCRHMYADEPGHGLGACLARADAAVAVRK